MFIFLYEFFISEFIFDEVWKYGFSLNIAKGLIPYSDYNLIQLTFYFLLMAGIMKVFRTSLVIFHLNNAFFVGFV